jgi:hypothetical protein
LQNTECWSSLQKYNLLQLAFYWPKNFLRFCLATTNFWHELSKAFRASLQISYLSEGTDKSYTPRQTLKLWYIFRITFYSWP